MATAQQQQFIESLMPAALEASQRTGVDPRIIIAQAAQETGWGRSAPNNNYFGIKSHGQGGGSTLMTHEYVNGQRVDMPQSFRGYGSPEESVQGYADFILQNPRYSEFRSAGDLQSQLDALQASGYATDPNYSQSVGSIARNIPLPQGAGNQGFLRPIPMPNGNPDPGMMQNLPAGASRIDPGILQTISGVTGQSTATTPVPPPNALSAYFAATQGGDSFLNTNPMNFLTANANGGSRSKSGGDIGNGLKIDERTRSLMGSAADGSRGRALAALPVLNTRDDGSVYARQGSKEIEMGSTRKESRRENDTGSVKFVAKSDGRELKPRQVMRKNKDTGKRETVTVYF